MTELKQPLILKQITELKLKAVHNVVKKNTYIAH